MPADIAIVVMTIGRTRLEHASRNAIMLFTPMRICSTAKSTNRIEFFVTMPTSIKIPINAIIDIGCCDTNKPITAPPSDSGNTIMIVMGWKKSWNSRTSTA